MTNEEIAILVHEFRALREVIRESTRATTYESMTLCPDSSAGHQALHEAIQGGWEVVAQWREDGVNHMALRRPETALSFTGFCKSCDCLIPAGASYCDECYH